MRNVKNQILDLVGLDFLRLRTKLNNYTHNVAT